MSYCQNQTSLFGASDKYIKFLNSNIVAIEGANTIETQVLASLRIKYAQIARARIVLKPGQQDYFLNYASMGEGVSFLSIVATYDPKSKIETDNYVRYTFYNDMTVIRNFCEVMILTGNSNNLIPQLYLTNPNTNYPVMLDVMMASKSDEYNYFVDTVNQAGTSFIGLSYSAIQTYVVNDTIKVVDSQGRALIYLHIDGISLVSPNGTILEIEDAARGTVFLKFLDVYAVNQAFSLINYILEVPGVNTATLVPYRDDIAPKITFRTTVLGTSSTIDLAGSTGPGPYNSEQGFTFSTSMSLTTFGTISSYSLLNSIVDNIVDSRDGTMSFTGSAITITKDSVTYTSITSSGTYSVSFAGVKDLAQNSNSNIILNLTVTS